MCQDEGSYLRKYNFPCFTDNTFSKNKTDKCQNVKWRNFYEGYGNCTKNRLTSYNKGNG